MERQEPVDMVLLVQLDLAQSAVPGGGAQWAHEEEGKKKQFRTQMKAQSYVLSLNWSPR